MARYKKNSPRLSVKFINGKTNELLSSVEDRSWMDIAEFFTDHYVSEIIGQQFKGKVEPEHIIVLVAANYYKVEE
jgi:hypothetical protein